MEAEAASDGAVIAGDLGSLRSTHSSFPRELDALPLVEAAVFDREAVQRAVRHLDAQAAEELVHLCQAQASAAVVGSEPPTDLLVVLREPCLAFASRLAPTGLQPPRHLERQGLIGRTAPRLPSELPRPL